LSATSGPVKLGFVASLNRPGGNVTGVTQLGEEVLPKRLELLHELLPSARVMALLINPAAPVLPELQTRVVLSAAKTFGLELHVLSASTERDFDAVFAKLIELRAGGLVIFRHDEADARIKLSRMPLDLGDHTPWLRPAFSLIAEIGM
jgi:putative tryptophan/tyrosine transport system substrate-binding protein